MTSPVTQTVTVVSPHGLHARPSHAIVAMVSRADAKVTLQVDGREADACSILSVMSLGAVHGAEVVLKAEGAQAEDVMKRLVAFFQDSFKENS